MQVYEFIHAKRLGKHHAAGSIHEFIAAYVAGNVTDAQAAAWCMAVCLQGMSTDEMSELTQAMIRSGDTVNLGDIPGIKVDKHSTGGVGDKTTLVLAPMVASIGLPVAKMSGRGLGHTGGTLDKLESFKGLRVEMDRRRFVDQVSRIGIAVAGQTTDLVPADRKLYALRDETATVESIPLIASSIMSKKLAAGADAFVLDVKAGSGAFMKDPAEARKLADAMVLIGQSSGKKTHAVISSMDQPLGRAIGNALEVREAIATLRGEGPDDLLELCLVLGGIMAMAGGVCTTIGEGRSRMQEAVRSGRALEKLQQLVEAQGGDPSQIDNPALLPAASIIHDIHADRSGFIASFDTLAVGLAAMLLGAGRSNKNDSIDPSVGFVLHKKLGDSVTSGEKMVTLHGNDSGRIQQAQEKLLGAITISEERPTNLPPLIYEF